MGINPGTLRANSSKKLEIFTKVVCPRQTLSAKWQLEALEETHVFFTCPDFL